jgi:hypothetical protein
MCEPTAHMAFSCPLQSSLERQLDLIWGRTPHTQRCRYASQPNWRPMLLPLSVGHDPQ